MYVCIYIHISIYIYICVYVGGLGDYKEICNRYMGNIRI